VTQKSRNENGHYDTHPVPIHSSTYRSTTQNGTKAHTLKNGQVSVAQGAMAVAVAKARRCIQHLMMNTSLLAAGRLMASARRPSWARG
jgi:hypothetical protein